MVEDYVLFGGIVVLTALMFLIGFLLELAFGSYRPRLGLKKRMDSKDG